MVKTHPDDCCIVGVIGRAGSGKDELADYICNQCGGQHLSIGSQVNAIADERNIDKTRQNQNRIFQEYYRKKGVDYFLNQIITKIETGTHELVVISGIRTPTDIEILKNRFAEKLLLVAVVVNNPRMRFHYVQNRNEPHDPKTFHAFIEQDEQDERLFKISAAIKLADFEVANNNSLERFYQIIQQQLVEDELRDYCSQQDEA